MMVWSAPRPVSTPRTEVASRQPCAVVSNSGIAVRCGDMCAGKSCRVPAARNDMAAIARQFVGEVLSPGLYSRRTAGAVPSGNFGTVYYAQWPRLKSPREPFHNVNHLLVRSAGRITELIASLLVHKPARRQLSRRWYARCVDGAAARVGRSFTYLWCCPALTARGRKRRAESAKLTMTVGVPSR